jgi:hypothetical protein
MKTIENYDDTYRRCWAIYEALRRFGFTSAQIESMHSKNGTLALRLSANDIEFIAVAGSVSDDHETVSRIWNEIGDIVLDKNVPNESFHKAWEDFMPPDIMQSLAYALVAKGIVLPKLTN